MLALAPFAAWLAVAVLRPTRRPVMDFLALGLLYGVSLVLVHQVLWDVGPSLGHNPPDAAVTFARSVDPALYDLALRAYTSMVAIGIGLGAGLVIAAAAAVASAVRSRRERGAP
ncbi:hypothetical protein GCM10027063_22270 [Promicromonospora xylanilytica]